MSYITGDDIKTLLLAGPYTSIPKLVNRYILTKTILKIIVLQLQIKSNEVLKKNKGNDINKRYVR